MTKLYCLVRDRMANYFKTLIQLSWISYLARQILPANTTVCCCLIIGKISLILTVTMYG